MRCALGIVAALVFGIVPNGIRGQEPVGDPAVERRVLEHAARLEEAGRIEEAMRALENQLRAYPSSISTLVQLARLSEREGEAARVLPLAEEAVRADRTGLPVRRQLWIGLLGSAGLRDSAESVARRWMEEEPLEPAPYLALSGVRGAAGDIQGAIEALKSGRRALSSDRLFVQELARLQEQLRLWPDAAVEWKAMLGWGSAGVEAVERSFTGIGSERPAAISALREELSRPQTSLLQKRGGVQLALVLGETRWARELVSELADGLPEPAGQEVLREYVGRARDAGDLHGAAWAAGSLATRSRDADERLYWESVAAELAFDSGDTATARSSFERIVREVPPGYDLHALSLRRLHRLVLESDPGGAERMLSEYRAVYPEDAEASVGMAVLSARRWLALGDLERARSVLGSASPGDLAQASEVAAVLGRLEVLAGHPGAARSHLELAATGGGAGLRIEALELLGLVDEADSASLAKLAEGLASLTTRDDAEPLLESVEGWHRVDAPAGERMAAFAAQQLEAAGRFLEARSVRITIVDGWPDSPAAPTALLELARSDRSRAPGEAIAWLERLIVDYPESAMAPVARRLLAELRSAGPLAPA